jgi:putative ABC transport system permease protein
MNLVQQARAVTVMNLKSLRERAASSLVVVIGMAVVVGVTVSVLSVAVGVSHSWDLVKRPGEVYVLSKTARFENQSSLSREKVVKIFDAPGVKRLADGKPAAVADFYFGVPLRLKTTRRERSLMVRGTSDRFFEYNPLYRIVEGRAFKPGLRELVVGKAASDAFDGVAIGSEIRLADGPWAVVGIYATDGGRTEWAGYGEVDTLMAASRRATFNSMSALLDGEEGLATFRAALDADPTLDVRVWTTEEFWNTNVGPQVAIFQGIAYGVGTIMGLGTLAAALSIMYAAVSARLVEIATLRAIGFSAGAVVI